jgi:hypothetical protein
VTETDWYAPNQQAVRADGSGPAEEGEGGSAPAPEGDELDAMTKDQLLAEAEARGIEGVSAANTKDEIKAAIRAG